MKLSTRVRYGVRFMVFLAEKYGQGPVFLKDIASEQGISEKYLSLIVIPLRAAGLVLSARGAHGGYTLAHDPKDTVLKDIVETLEGETCLVDCIKKPSSCTHISLCSTRHIWQIVGEKISKALSEVTLYQLAVDSREKKQKQAQSEM